MRPLIYLASPHSDPDPHVRHRRFRQVVMAAAIFWTKGYLVFSPIAHSHPIHVVMQANGEPDPDWTFYAEFDTKFLHACDELWVLQLEGWEKSKGVTAEIKLVTEIGKLIRYINPENIHDY